MIGIDLFAGSGGLSLGARQAGIDVALAVEYDSHACRTYTHNHPNTNIFFEDIRKLDRIGIDTRHKSTILFGGPPCQGFSTSNQRTRHLQNPDNWLFCEFLRILRLWRPDWVVFENVTGIRETKKGLLFEQIMSGIEMLGYTTFYWILCATDYGVPQKRTRLFIIGSRHGITVPKPLPSVTIPVTVKEAIFDLPELQNGACINVMPYKCKPTYPYAQSTRGELQQSSNHLVTKSASHIIDRYSCIPQGGNWQHIPPQLMRNYSDVNKCHTGIYHRLREDSPSVVIGNYRKNMLIHPIQNRGLSVREAARLQSFPDSYEFMGSIGFQQQQVGNAVPPLLAKAVFEAIINAELEGNCYSKETTSYLCKAGTSVD